MTTEWTDLPTLQDVAKAQADGWEIEARFGPHWEEWKGIAWMNHMKFRARPRQPKMKKVKMLCWHYSNELHWLNSSVPPQGHWIRVPAEDKTVEVPEVKE